MPATPSDPLLVCTYAGTLAWFSSDAGTAVGVGGYTEKGLFHSGTSGVTDLFGALAAGFTIACCAPYADPPTLPGGNTATTVFVWTLNLNSTTMQPVQLLVLYSDPSTFNADVGAWLYEGWLLSNFVVSEHFGRDVIYVTYSGSLSQQVPPGFLGIIPVYTG